MQDPGLIPGVGRSAGESTGYPLQYSWSSLVANWMAPGQWEKWVRWSEIDPIPNVLYWLLYCSIFVSLSKFEMGQPIIYKTQFRQLFYTLCVCTHTHTHTHTGILLSHKKGWNFDIYNNMDKLGGHYTKWHKSDRERQIPYDITYMQNLNCTTN